MKPDLPPIPYVMTSRDKDEAATYAVLLEKQRREANARDERRELLRLGLPVDDDGPIKMAVPFDMED